MSYILMVFVLGMLILVHELGHLVAAKGTGIPVERFSVGFGPRLLGFRMNGTEYWLSLIPLGGYVMPHAEEDDELMQISLWRRVLFCLGGPLANVVAAWACLAVFQAAATGVSLPALILKPAADLSAMAHQILSALPALFRQTDQMSGIVGIVAMGGQLAGSDLTRLFGFSVFLNVNLAIFNLLPLPPLDGGKICFFILQSIWKPMTRLHVPVAITGWVLMLVLMIYATVADVGRLMTG
jgi:regulator of sigma E protease